MIAAAAAVEPIMSASHDTAAVMNNTIAAVAVTAKKRIEAAMRRLSVLSSSIVSDV